ncbi:hypothetical protein KKG05_08045 [bacterium]|nr:hypothetical protein [bacterium]
MTKTLFHHDDFLVVPRIGEVYRLLGGREEDASERLRDMVDEALLMGYNLSKPRAVYGIFDSDFKEPALKNSLGPIALCICTIGSNLEEKVREFSDNGQSALATALDAVGSETVEALANAVDARICEKAAEDRLAAWPRFSPGYGDWTLESGQRLIFSNLPAGKIGIELTPTFLMNPLKSISFAMKLAASPPEGLQASKCEQCDKQDCYYRR